MSTSRSAARMAPCTDCGAVAVIAATGLCWPCYRVEKKHVSLKTRAKKYGVTVEVLREMLTTQRNVCAICRVGPKEKLVVDHNHKTGEVRGWLCQQCNKGIGHFSDDPELLRFAAEYLIQRATHGTPGSMVGDVWVGDALEITG